MADRTENVKQWVWVDYDQPGWSAYQVLLTDETGQILSNTIAVAMTLTLPRLLRFAKLFFPQELKSERQGGGHTNEESLERLQNRELQPLREVTSDGGTNTLISTRAEGSTGEHSLAADIENGPTQPQPTIVDMPQRAFFPTPHISSRIGSGIMNTIYNARTLEEAAVQVARKHLAMGRNTVGEENLLDGSRPKRMFDVLENLKQDTWSFALISALMLMLFGLFIGEQVVAIFVAGVMSGSTGLSASPNCGNWIGDYNLAGHDLFLYQSEALAAAQERATLYVENCYDNSTATLEACNIYYNRTISYSKEHNASCPFLGNVCLYGQTSAYALDTGYVDSNVLGINAAKRYQFKRKTTCSPIVMNSSYINYWNAVDRPDLSQIATYDYGNNETDIRTLIQPVDFPFGHVEYTHGNGYYHFRTHGTTLYGAGENRNILRSEFLPPVSDISLLFIRPKALVYSKPSDDPIFPADALLNNDSTYYNSLPHATVLGCVDSTEIRHPDTGQIWIPRNFTTWRTNSTEWEALPMNNIFLLLGLALDNSNTWNAINYGVRLDAERKIVYPGGTSLPLAREQWKVEARKMFEISLALAQGRVYDIARGTDILVPGVRNTFQAVNQPICEMVKIPTIGWTNVSLFWLVTLPTVAFLLWFTSIQVGGGLVIVWAYSKVLKPGLTWLFRNIWAVLELVFFSLRWLCKKIWSLLLSLWNSTIDPDGLRWVVREIIGVCKRGNIRIRWRTHRDEEGVPIESYA